MTLLMLYHGYMQLKRSGRNYFGLCPFHNEKSPSFSVSPDKQIFHCFGCGAGGNAISFIMKIEGINFIEAVQMLAERSNITLPSLEGNQDTAKEILAYELTKLVHGEEEANKAQNAAKSVFGKAGVSDDMPTTKISVDDLNEDGCIGLLTLLVKCGLASSNGEARRLVQQGGVSINDEKVLDPKAFVNLVEPVIIKKGKKVFHKAEKE